MSGRGETATLTETAIATTREIVSGRGISHHATASLGSVIIGTGRGTGEAEAEAEGEALGRGADEAGETETASKGTGRALVQ